MIITCPCEKKQFKIDSSLIPVEGRELQCGSCEKVWFYKPQNDTKAPLTLSKDISIIKTDQDIKTKEKNIEFSKKLTQEKIVEPKIKETAIEKEISKNVKKTRSKLFRLFSYLIVFIISFVALIILIDTLKTPLITVYPGLEFLLFNLFETLQDIKLFIIDLT